MGERIEELRDGAPDGAVDAEGTEDGCTDGDDDGNDDGASDSNGDAEGSVKTGRFDLREVIPSVTPAVIPVATMIKPSIRKALRLCSCFRSAADFSTTTWPSTRGKSSPGITRSAFNSNTAPLAPSFGLVARTEFSSFEVRGRTTGPSSWDTSSSSLRLSLFLLLLPSGPATEKAPG